MRRCNRRLRPVSSCAAVLIVTALLGVVGCGGDSPVEPAQPKDYVVWCSDGSGQGKYYGYHLLTGRMDSFSVAVQPTYGMTVSADGKRLYVPTTTGSPGTAVIDIEQQTIIETVPASLYSPSHGQVFSPDGRYVAFQGDDLYILSYPDHNVVYHDTAYVWMGWFTPDSRKFYAAGYNTNQVLVVDMATLEATTWDNFLPYSVRHVRQTVDDDRWLVYLNIPQGAGAFGVVDHSRDSLLFFEFLAPGSGMIASTPDGRYAFYDNPGGEVDDIPPTPEFRVFDALRGQIDRLISTVGVVDGIEPANAPIGYLYVTPDGNWLFAAAKWGDYLFVYDAHTFELVRYYEPQGIWLRAFTGPVGVQ